MATDFQTCHQISILLCMGSVLRTGLLVEARESDSGKWKVNLGIPAQMPLITVLPDIVLPVVVLPIIVLPVIEAVEGILSLLG